MRRDALLEQDPVLPEMVDRFVHALHPEQIYLFGSRPRGDIGPDGDYDLLAVVPESDLTPQRRDVLAFWALCGVGAAKEVVMWTREEFESRSRAASSLPATVLREEKTDLCGLRWRRRFGSGWSVRPTICAKPRRTRCCAKQSRPCGPRPGRRR